MTSIFAYYPIQRMTDYYVFSFARHRCRTSRYSYLKHRRLYVFRIVTAPSNAGTLSSQRSVCIEQEGRESQFDPAHPSEAEEECTRRPIHVYDHFFCTIWGTIDSDALWILGSCYGRGTRIKIARSYGVCMFVCLFDSVCLFALHGMAIHLFCFDSLYPSCWVCLLPG
jgi:hypothetical protein